MVTSSPENAETAFVGLQVLAAANGNGLSLNMRREGDHWEQRAIEDTYSRHQIRSFSWDPSAPFALITYARQAGASLRRTVFRFAGLLSRMPCEL